MNIFLDLKRKGRSYLQENNITKANHNHISTIDNIVKYGVWDKDDKLKPRGRYADGEIAYSKQIFHTHETYSILHGEFPITNIRSVAPKSSIGEILWIYQDQSNSLELLEEKYKVSWWKPWDIGDGTIGSTYGEIIRKYDMMNRLLKGMETDPYSKRHIMNMWQEDSLRQKIGLPPCAFMTEWNIIPMTTDEGEKVRYLTMKLTQRSSDYLTANSINKLQYYALMLMVCGHLTHKTGINHFPYLFSHAVTNVHIYDRHFDKILDINNDIRENQQLLCVQPFLSVNGNKDFYDYTIDDFKLHNMETISKVGNFEIAI